MRVSSTTAFAVFAALAASLEALPVHDRPGGFADTEVVASPRRILFRRDSDAAPPPSPRTSGTTTASPPGSPSASEAQSQPTRDHDDVDAEETNPSYVDLTDSSPPKFKSGSASSYNSSSACCSRSPSRIMSWDEPEDDVVAPVVPAKVEARVEKVPADEAGPIDEQDQSDDEQSDGQDESSNAIAEVNVDAATAPALTVSDAPVSKEAEDQWVLLPGPIAPELFDMENLAYDDPSRTQDLEADVKADDSISQPEEDQDQTQTQEQEVIEGPGHAQDQSSVHAPTKTTKLVEESKLTTATKAKITSVDEEATSDSPAVTGTPVPTKTTVTSPLDATTQVTTSSSSDVADRTTPEMFEAESRPSQARDADAKVDTEAEATPENGSCHTEDEPAVQELADDQSQQNGDQDDEEDQDDTEITPPPTGTVSRASTTESSSRPTTSWDQRHHTPSRTVNSKGLSNGQVVMTDAGGDPASQSVAGDQVQSDKQGPTDEVGQSEDDEQERTESRNDSSSLTPAVQAANLRLSSALTSKDNTSSREDEPTQIALGNKSTYQYRQDEKRAQDSEAGARLIESVGPTDVNGRADKDEQERPDGDGQGGDSALLAPFTSATRAVSRQVDIDERTGPQSDSRSVDSNHRTTSGYRAADYDKSVYSSRSPSRWRHDQDQPHAPARHRKPPISWHRTNSDHQQQQWKPNAWRSGQRSPRQSDHARHSEHNRRQQHSLLRDHLDQMRRKEAVHGRPWIQWHRKMGHAR